MLAQLAELSYQILCVHCLHFFVCLLFRTRVSFLTLSELYLRIVFCRLIPAMDITVKTSLPTRTTNQKCGLKIGLAGMLCHTNATFKAE